MNEDPAPTGIKSKGFLRRLSYYLMGISIGLCILGAFHVAKSRETERQAAAQRLLDEAPKPVDTLFPPPPGITQSAPK